MSYRCTLVGVVSKRQSKSRSLAEVVGAAVHDLRAGLGLTQDELARRLKDAGGDWDQAAIARLEAGRRELRLEQVLFLWVALDVAVSDLLAGDDDDWIVLSPRARWRLSAVRAALGGVNASTLPAGDFDDPSVRGFTAALTGRDELHAVVSTVWPAATRAQSHAAIDAVGEAERKAGRRLGVSPVAVSAAAFRTWGQSFAARRDAVAAELAETGGGRRSLQAGRGHVTRQLLAELAPILKEEPQ